MCKCSDFCLPFVTALALVIVPFAANSQDKPVLLVVGSAHFANPGRDTINLTVEDVLTDTRQKEIEHWSNN